MPLMSDLKQYDICEVLSDSSNGLLPGSIVRVEVDQLMDGPAVICSVIFANPGPSYEQLEVLPRRVFLRCELRVL